MSSKRSTSRRRFLSATATASATAMAVPYFVSSRALGDARQGGANDRLQIALIGAGGMGRSNLKNCAADPNVEITGVCDVWAERRAAVQATYKNAKPYKDFRELLADDALDGVIIATPPHWHCLIAIAACEAGKDIYLQKPMTIHMAESLALRNAVRKHKTVSQIGTQIHAGENYRRVVEWVRSGRLGPISVVRTLNVENQGPDGLGNTPNSVPPPGLDWDLWVGPAEMCDYNPLITRSAHENCSFMQFSGGWTPGMAPHIIDLPYWALELGVPQRTSCTGGRYIIQDPGDAPDTQEVTWQFSDLTLTWTMSAVSSYAFDFGSGSLSRRLGIYFHGTDATLYSNYSQHEVVPEGKRLKDLTPPEKAMQSSPGHELEWLQCMRTRQQPSCCVDYHGNIDLAINLANLSMKVGRDIHVDPQTGKIRDDPEAARLAVPAYRAPWQFPHKYL